MEEEDEADEASSGSPFSPTDAAYFELERGGSGQLHPLALILLRLR